MGERTNVHNVGGVRRALEGLPDNAPVIVQVVDEAGRAWNVFLDIGQSPNFKWDVNPVIFTASHPELRKLPCLPDAPPLDVPEGAVLADIDDEVPISIALSTVDGLKVWMKRQAADVAQLRETVAAYEEVVREAEKYSEAESVRQLAAAALRDHAHK